MTAPLSAPDTRRPRYSPVDRVRTFARSYGRPPRHLGLDVARGLAVLGMAGAHLGLVPELEWGDPSTWGGLVNGRSSILFAVLAGISIALVTGRTQRPPVVALPGMRLRLVGRGATIFAIGIVLELLNTPVAVILTVYGVLYVAALPFLRWRPSRLLAASAVLALAGPALLEGLRVLSLGAYGAGLDFVVFGIYPLTVWMAFLLAGMAIGRLRLDRARVAAILLGVGVALSAVGYGVGALVGPSVDRLLEESWQEDLGDSVDSSFDSSTGFTDDGYVDPGEYSIEKVPTDEIDLDGLVCEVDSDGWVFCLPPEDYTPTSSYDSSVDYSGSYVEEGDDEDVPYLEQVADQHPWTQLLGALTADDPHSGGTLEILGSGGFAVALIGLCLLLARPLRWALLPLGALGSMPLTAYAAHVVVLLAVAGPGGYVSSNELWGWTSLGLVLGTLVWAVLVGRGPLERLVGRVAEATARGIVR